MPFIWLLKYLASVTWWEVHYYAHLQGVVNILGYGDLTFFSMIIAEDLFISGSWVLMVYCGLSVVSWCGWKGGRVDG